MSVYRLTLATLRNRVRNSGSLEAAVLRQALPVLRTLAVAGVQEHFQRQESPDGKPWLPLAHPRPNGGDKVLLDRGTLRASVKASTDIQAGKLVLTASHPAARVHQFGADIKPKRGKYLAIPLTREAKRVGSPRQNHFPRPLIVVTVDNDLYLCESRPRKLIFQYLLVKSVRIPPRPFVGFSRRTLDRMDRAIADAATDTAVALFEPKSADWGRITRRR